MTKHAWIAAGLSCLVLIACRPPAPAASALEASAGADEPRSVAVADSSELLRLASQALQHERLYAPQGDNAVEFYLAARDREPDDAAIRTALIELQPYILIATEQAVERRDLSESQRLLGLMQRLDPGAPALTRLLAAVQAIQAQTSTPQVASLSPDQAPPRSGSSIPRSPSPEANRAAAGAEPSLSPPIISASPASIAADVAAAQPAPGAMASSRPASQEAPPRLLQDAQPRYPLPALRNRIEGQVDVAFVIRPDGSVGEVRLVSAQPQGVFDASALAVAQRWRFEASDRSHARQRTVQFRLPSQ